MKLRTDIDELTSRLAGRVGDVGSPPLTHLGTSAPDGGTTRPLRMAWFGLGMVVGAVVALLADPANGRTRRARLRDRATALGHGATTSAAQKSRFLAGRAKGAAMEAAGVVLPQDVPSDARTLQQRVRSHVFGYRDDVQDVVITVTGPGRIALRGTVSRDTSVDELLSEVHAVEGVLDVHDELVVRGS